VNEGNALASLEMTWDADLNNPKVSPVKRVVLLLQKMKSELENEAAKEAEMYDKMVCWCKTNDKEKTQAIADAEARETDLEDEIGSRSARFGELSAQIAQLKKDIAAESKALEDARSVREKEAAAFTEEHKDLVQAITNLKNAIAVLGRHQGDAASLLQAKNGDASLSTSMHALMADLAEKYDLLLGDRKAAVSLLQLDSGSAGSLSQQLRKIVAKGPSTGELPMKFAARIVAQNAGARPGVGAAFLQAGTPGDYKSYSSRSDGIFGIMNQMLDEFTAKQKEMEEDEARNQKDYDALAAAKTKQIAASKKKLDEQELESANNDKALSDAKENLDLTRKQRSADVEFLRKLKITCGDLDNQWAQRSKTRSEETLAVNEAIAILTEDESRELIYKSVPAFVQISSESRSLRTRVLKVLRRGAGDGDGDLLSTWNDLKAAGGVSSAPMSALAVSVQIDSFKKVKAMMDKMVADLKKEQADEVKFKAYCVAEIDKNEKQRFKRTRENTELQASIDQLDARIEKLAAEIADAKKQIADTKTAIKSASENREAENAEFQSVITDQRATQAILTKALKRLQEFYKGKLAAATSFSQVKQTPPVQFNDYNNNAGSNSVMGMLEQIIGDSKALEAEAISGEAQAQSDYEAFVNDSNGLIKSLTNAITQKSKATAEAEVDKQNAISDLTSGKAELADLEAFNKDMHDQCDWTLKNFGTRQSARLAEIEAIQEAKGILSGAK